MDGDTTPRMPRIVARFAAPTRDVLWRSQVMSVCRAIIALLSHPEASRTPPSARPSRTKPARRRAHRPSHHGTLPRAQADSPLNCDCGNLIRNGDMRGYRSLAAMYTKIHAVAADGAGPSAS